jgi:hypothetical protein
MKLITNDSITEDYYDTVSELLYQYNLKNTKDLETVKSLLRL